MLNSNKVLSEQDLAQIMNQLLCAINYCHKVLKIMHYDLKIENIMFANKDQINSLKIIDFGLS